MDDLKDYLLKLAEANHVEYELYFERPDFVSRAVPEDDLIIINTNWKRPFEVPFIIGHETGHIVHGDNITKCESPTAHFSCELEADKYSFDFIFDYNLIQDEIICEPEAFLQQYGIPDRLLPYALEVFKNNRNKLF